TAYYPAPPLGHVELSRLSRRRRVWHRLPFLRNELIEIFTFAPGISERTQTERGRKTKKHKGG
ncbi:hypothetical protein X777_04644, partial [Ooceraea biroi]